MERERWGYLQNLEAVSSNESEINQKNKVKKPNDLLEALDYFIVYFLFKKTFEKNAPNVHCYIKVKPYGEIASRVK
jgi:hypothetical protein